MADLYTHFESGEDEHIEIKTADIKDVDLEEICLCLDEQLYDEEENL